MIANIRSNSLCCAFLYIQHFNDKASYSNIRIEYIYSLVLLASSNIIELIIEKTSKSKVKTNNVFHIHKWYVLYMFYIHLRQSFLMNFICFNFELMNKTIYISWNWRGNEKHDLCILENNNKFVLFVNCYVLIVD